MQSKRTIFKNASTTYYYSSLFFSRDTWQEVATLYAYVRLADDYVDAQPQQYREFAQFVAATKECLVTGALPDHPQAKHILDFVELMRKKQIPKSWLIAFLRSMASDLNTTDQWIEYQTREQLAAYVHGSAEVIGLCMSKILGLPRVAYRAAALQGAAMQHINFIRDIAEDCRLGRVYLPKQDRLRFGLEHSVCEYGAGASAGSGPSEGAAPDANQHKAFIDYLNWELALYHQLQARADAGYEYIPYRYRVPIATAAELYRYTAHCIQRDPHRVFREKIKPSKLRVLLVLCKMMVRCLWY